MIIKETEELNLMITEKNEIEELLKNINNEVKHYEDKLMSSGYGCKMKEYPFLICLLNI